MKEKKKKEKENAKEKSKSLFNRSQKTPHTFRMAKVQCK